MMYMFKREALHKHSCCPHRAASYFCPDISTLGYLFVSSFQAPLHRKSAIGEFMMDRLESVTLCFDHSLSTTILLIWEGKEERKRFC